MNTAEIMKDKVCECGWPIIFACCNWDYKPSHNYDWWVYCTNKGCSHHKGEGIFQDEPDWIHSTK